MDIPPTQGAINTPADERTIRVRILAYARLRELLGETHLTLTLADGSRVDDVWSALRDIPELEAARGSARIARNGAIAVGGETLQDGDELALLPPFGGG